MNKTQRSYTDLFEHQHRLAEQFNEAQSRLVIQSSDLPLGTLADMVAGGAIDLEPSFQRRERWKAEDQSSLIESFLLNVPVPPIYLAEERNGTYTAIDGKQRLNAIFNFISDRLVLGALDGLPTASGFKFSQLPPEIQNSLRLRPYIRVITLLKQTNVDLKYEVFLRLNKGGERLNAQEIRNVAYRGDLNDLIFDLSENEILHSQLKIRDKSSSAYRKMEDAEYVLRFLTLRNRWQSFSGQMAKEMDRFMERYRATSPSVIAEMRTDFDRSIASCGAIWGDNAFQRPEKGGWRDQFLAGMYDAQMLAVSMLSDPELDNAISDRDAVVQRTRALFDDKEFEEAVRVGTNTPSRIELRTSKMIEALVQ